MARFGGDEFIVLLAFLKERDDAALVARKLLKALKPPISLGEQEVYITASVGIAPFPADGDCWSRCCKEWTRPCITPK